MAQYARVKLKKAPHTESVIPIKGYELLKKKYTLIGFEDAEGGELTEVQKIMAEKIAKKKAAEAAGDKEQVETKNESTESTETVTQAPDYELEDLRSQYLAKFGKEAKKNFKAETIKAKLNEV